MASNYRWIQRTRTTSVNSLVGVSILNRPQCIQSTSADQLHGIGICFRCQLTYQKPLNNHRSIFPSLHASVQTARRFRGIPLTTTLVDTSVPILCMWAPVVTSMQSVDTSVPLPRLQTHYLAHEQVYWCGVGTLVFIDSLDATNGMPVDLFNIIRSAAWHFLFWMPAFHINQWTWPHTSYEDSLLSLLMVRLFLMIKVRGQVPWHSSV